MSGDPARALADWRAAGTRFEHAAGGTTHAIHVQARGAGAETLLLVHEIGRASCRERV